MKRGVVTIVFSLTLFLTSVYAGNWGDYGIATSQFPDLRHGCRADADTYKYFAHPLDDYPKAYGGGSDLNNERGMAEVCNVCYVCGVPDGICPEDFAVQDANQPGGYRVAWCINPQDIDCTTSVQGFVYSDDTKEPIEEATVTFEPSALSVGIEPLTMKTDEYGYYRFDPVVSGRWTVVIEKTNYDTYINQIIMNRNGTKEQDFYLASGTCNADCTDFYGRCNPACEGVKSCSYPDPEIRDKCEGKEKGTYITTGDDEDNVYRAQCCSGFNLLTEYRPVARMTSTAPNCVVQRVVTRMDSEPVIVNLVVCDR